MNAFLPSMEPAVVQREKVRRKVRATSIAQYADGRERFTGRKADVLRWLAAFYNKHQFAPTSEEVAAWGWNDWSLYDGPRWMKTDWTRMVLYARRGLSDLQTSGVVESVPNGKRKAPVSGRVCETWRVKPAGRGQAVSQ